MSGLFFLLPTLLVVLFSFLIVRAAAIALMMTGMEEKRAKFQALSAFSGTGFTTKEAESVVGHPKRRKIVTWLMILGNAGVVTVIVTGTSSLVSSKGYNLPLNVMVLVIGIFVIYKLATHKGFIKKWESFIQEKLVKIPVLEEETVEDLLRLVEGYGLVKAIIKEGSPLIGDSLSQCELSAKGLLVLGIEREKGWIPVPGAEETVKDKDKLVVYGSLDVIRDIFK